MSRTYTDSRRKAIVFPLGDASFADEVVSFDIGKPAPRDPRSANAMTALGPPDYDPKTATTKPAAVALGCGGTLTFRFTDNVLHDVAGPDLYVFEVGPAIEPMKLAISPDGETWTEVGNISGGTATIDIAKAVKPGDRFRYVRVTDLKRGCGGPYAGADVDAVGAIGSTLKLSFDASVLFDFNRSELRPEAQARLAEAATRGAAYANASVTVAGHTDNVGTDASPRSSRWRAPPRCAPSCCRGPSCAAARLPSKGSAPAGPSPRTPPTPAGSRTGASKSS